MVRKHIAGSKVRSAAAVAAVAALGASGSRAVAGTAYQHVLILSVDGLHAADVTDPSLAASFTNVNALRQSGVTYTQARTTVPSDSFPGTLAYLTGAGPATTGVYYDDSYDRTLLPPTALGGGTTPGTETQFAENIDKNSDLLNGGGNSDASSIDTAQLPRNPVTGALVYPHNFLKVNTIFNVATNAGLHTAFSDKHPAYEIANGPSGNGVQDFFAPEVNSKAAFLDPTNPSKTVKGSSLPVNTDVKTLTMVDPSTDPLGASDPNLQTITKSFLLTEKYDDVKVAAIINEINGKSSRGVAVGYTPNLYAMNFQAVSVAQKDVAGGIPSTGNPSAELAAAIAHTDASIGAIQSALKSTGQWNNTLLALTAKHGQNPRVGQVTYVDPSIYPNALTAAGIQVAQSTEDDIALIWLKDPSQAAQAAAVIQALQAGGKDPEINQVLSGQGIVNAGLGNPATNSRTPDLVVTIKTGYGLYTGGKNAEHGGDSPDDTNVALILSSGALPTTLDGTSYGGVVDTKQIAVTALDALGLDPAQLQGALAEGTQVLPAAGITAVPLPNAAKAAPLGLLAAGLFIRRYRKQYECGR